MTKTLALLAAGYKVIRVRQEPLPFLDIVDENYSQLNYDKQTLQELSDLVVSLINKLS